MKSKVARFVSDKLSFAHLAGIGRAKGARAEDDDTDKDEQDREDVDSKKSKAEVDDDDVEDDDKKSKKARASDDDDVDDDKKSKAEVDDDDAEDDDKKSKKAKASDDDDDEEMRGNSAEASARRREQARCATIFASAAAAKNPALAANLAFKTRMTRQEALAVLEGTPVAAPAEARTRHNPNLGNGASSEKNSAQQTASSWDRAFAAVNPSRRK